MKQFICIILLLCFNLLPLTSYGQEAEEFSVESGLYGAEVRAAWKGDTKKLFLSCETFPAANTLIPENFLVTDAAGEEYAVENVYYYAAEGVLTLETAGGSAAEEMNVRTRNVTDIDGEVLELTATDTLVAEYTNPVFETSIRSIQLTKDGIAVSAAESDGIYEITVRLTNEGREEDIILHIVKNSGDFAREVAVIPTEGREILTEEVSLSAGDTIYAFLENTDTAESEPLIYDMDLTDFSADAETIANSVEKRAALKVTKADSGTYGKAFFTNAAGEQVPYINMEHNDTVLSYENFSLAGRTLTLETWVNRRSSIGRQNLLRIFGKDEVGDAVNEAKLQSGSHSFEDVPYASSWSVPNRDTSSQKWFYSMISNAHIKQDAWIHIAIVRDMSVEGKVTETYYFNGAKIKSWTYEAPAEEAAAGFSVQGGSMPQFNVADVKVYANTAFADSEIKAHYNAEKATYAQANELVSAQGSAYRLRDSNDKGVMHSSGSKDYGQTFYFESGINSPTNGVVLIAIYEDGRLETVKSVQVTAETASPLRVEFTNGITYDANAKYEIKAFTWDGMTELQPYGKAKSYQFK